MDIDEDVARFFGCRSALSWLGSSSRTDDVSQPTFASRLGEFERRILEVDLVAPEHRWKLTPS